MTGQPTTAAGRVLLSCIDLDYENYDPDPHSMIRAIETEARSQLLDELIAKVEGLPGWMGSGRDVGRAAVIAILTAARDGQPTTDL